MPTPDQILQLLTLTAQQNILLAGVWHLAVLLGIIAWFMGWKPSKRFTAMLLSLPLLSVSLMAWRYGNSFNGMVFALLTMILILLAVRMPSESVQLTGKPWMLVGGILTAIFGLIYPHFLSHSPWWQYLWAAPTGLVPCPTLSLVIGLTLIFNGLSSRNWNIILFIAGVFYGFFGILRLGVFLDLGLLFGSLLLLFLVFTLRSRLNK